MSDEQTQRLFKEFGKLDDKVGINKEGIGLGLSITKNLVKHLGGDIEVSSSIG